MNRRYHDEKLIQRVIRSLRRTTTLPRRNLPSRFSHSYLANNIQRSYTRRRVWKTKIKHLLIVCVFFPSTGRKREFKIHGACKRFWFFFCDSHTLAPGVLGHVFGWSHVGLSEVSGASIGFTTVGIKCYESAMTAMTYIDLNVWQWITEKEMKMLMVDVWCDWVG